MRVLTAPPVSVSAQRKEKPKTAKEALRAKTEQQRISRGPGPKTSKAEARAEKAKKREEEADEREAEDAAEDSKPTPEPTGWWHRVKRLFGR